MESFLWTMLAAAITGLTWIAYTHHRSFAKIHKWLTYISIFIYVYINTWDMGAKTMITAITTSMYKTDRLDSAHKIIVEEIIKAASEKELPYMNLIIVVFLCFNAYIFF